MIKDTFFAERHNWFLWVPVIFGTGICLYFAWPEEPPFYAGICGVIMASVSLALLRKQYAVFHLIATFILILSLGFANAQWRSLRQTSPILPKLYHASPVTGIITDIDIQPSGYRIILKPLSIATLPAEELPQYIRLTVRTSLEGVNPGDTVKTLAILDPPPIPAFPGAYDFARIAYFQQIGGVGYTIQPVTLADTTHDISFFTAISHLRKNIADRIIAYLGKDKGSIASALLVGESNAIPKSIYTDIRTSGLAHLISISGLHLSLVVGIFYLFSRRMMALSETLTLHVNIKKWAAICGLLGSAGYLLIAGMPIPAQRAYIMASLMLLAIVFDRHPSPLRSVAWAAFIILVIEPESVLTPSFQMSFAAVIALISGYRALAGIFAYWNDTLPETKRRFHSRLGLYVYGIILSTLIAGMATLPFGIYHFNNYASYSILANMVAIPVTSFWVMPFGVIALLLYPLHLEALALYPMQWGIDVILITAQKVAHLPLASGYVPSLPTYGFIMIILSMCWLLLWERKWRLYGIPFILLGILTPFLSQTPDIIIDQKGKLFAVKNTEGELVFNNNRLAHYTRKLWMQRAGQSETVSLSKRMGLTCNPDQCSYENGHQTVVFVQNATVLHEACNTADIVINLTWTYTPCPHPKTTISRRNLYYQGTHVLWLGEKGIAKLQTVNAIRGKRPWVSHPTTGGYPAPSRYFGLAGK